MSDEVFFDEARRWFYRGDRKVPSASQIVGRFYPIPPYVTKWHLERGSMVHSATVMIDRGTLDWKALDGRIRPFCDRYRDWRALLPGLMIVASEKKVCHPSGRFSGRLDRIFHLPGDDRDTVVDIKVGGVDEKGWWVDACYAKCADPQGWRRFGRAILTLGGRQADLRFDPDPERHARGMGRAGRPVLEGDGEMSDKVKVVIELHGGIAYLKEDESLQRTHLDVIIHDYDIQGIDSAAYGDIYTDPDGKQYWRYSA